MTTRRIIVFAMLAIVLSDPSRSIAAPSQIVFWGNNDYGQTNLFTTLTNVVGVAAGSLHSVALRADGSVGVWGSTSNAPANLTDAVAVMAGYENTIAVRANGTVTTWHGQDMVPAGLTNVVAAGVGWYHWAALRANGTVVAWGNNRWGQTNVPKGLSNVTAIAVGGDHTLALRANGTVAAWGYNSLGSVIVPANLSNVVAIDATRHLSIALRSDGTLVSWGRYWNGTSEVAMTIPDTVRNVTAVSIGASHGLAQRADGELIAWGEGPLIGQVPSLTNIPPAATRPAGFAAGWYHNVVLLGDEPPRIAQPLLNRTVLAGETTSFRVVVSGASPLRYQWKQDGTDIPGATNNLLMVENVVPAKTGLYSVTVSNAFGVVTNGASLSVSPATILVDPRSQVTFRGATVTMTAAVSVAMSSAYQWRFNGTNLPGATNTTLDLVDVQEEQAGAYTFIVSNSGGTTISREATLRLSPIVTWGPRFQPDLSNVVAIAAQSGVYSALRSDGTIASWRGLDSGAVGVPPDVTNVVAVASGYGFGIRAVLRADGTVTTWTEQNGTNIHLPTPSGLTNVAAIFLGGDFTVALRENGTVAVWGETYRGMTNIPAGLSNVVAISAGLYHVLALRSDGTVVAWGETNAVWVPHEEQPTTVPANLTNVIAIASGYFHNVALRADGTVAAWGSHGCDLTNTPPGLNAIAVSAASYFSVALRRDGTVAAWGGWCDPEFGPSGGPMVPEGLTNVIAIAGDAALIGQGVSLPAPRWTTTQLEDRWFKATLTTLLGKTYVIERKSALSDGTWQFERVVAGRAAPISIQVPIVDGNAFYRVRRLP